MGARTLAIALAVSAAFNLGFVGTTAYHSCQAPVDRTSCMPAESELSAEVVAMATRLDRQLEPLRRRQAEHTRRLAELMAVEAPDAAAIDTCLDDLASVGREIQGLVVRTVLEQRDLLPEEQRTVFCNNVQRRLCDPWASCEPASCAPEDRPQQPETDTTN